MASDIVPPSSKREKVALKPGFHLVDWMRLTQVSDVSGRKGNPLRKISMKEVEMHNTQYDCWTVYNKKVYNISLYSDYHPGGVAKLMLGAGKDCTKLFNKYHSWVNCESILGKCLLGTLIEEESTIKEESEEETLEDEKLVSMTHEDSNDTLDEEEKII